VILRIFYDIFIVSCLISCLFLADLGSAAFREGAARRGYCWGNHHDRLVISIAEGAYLGRGIAAWGALEDEITSLGCILDTDATFLDYLALLGSDAFVNTITNAVGGDSTSRAIELFLVRCDSSYNFFNWRSSSTNHLFILYIQKK